MLVVQASLSSGTFHTRQAVQSSESDCLRADQKRLWKTPEPLCFIQGAKIYRQARKGREENLLFSLRS